MEGAAIIDIHARELLDSRGNPTIEVEVYSDEFIGSAAVPSGASTGSHEALELRDGGARYGGKGVLKAVKNVNGPIKDALLGVDVTDQAAIDQMLLELDGTENKRKLGANAMLGVSLAVSRAASAAHEMPLFAHLAKLAGKTGKFTMPLPYANVINGGKHAENDLMCQEFMIVPVGAKSMEEAVRMVSEVYHELKQVIEKRHGKDAANVGDEGGFAPPIRDPEHALTELQAAVKAAGHDGRVLFAIDAAASEFYDAKTGKYEIEKGKKLTGKELGAYWLDLLKRFPIISLEDPFFEDDDDSWREFMKLLKATPKTAFKAGRAPQVVGDDLTVSNPARIKHAIKEKLCDALLLKVNQIGTLSEALEAAKLAFGAGWHVMVSHRSGETEDPYIADLAVGLGCGQIKLGAPCRGERTAKYNQLLRISEEAGDEAKFVR